VNNICFIAFFHYKFAPSVLNLNHKIPRNLSERLLAIKNKSTAGIGSEAQLSHPQWRTSVKKISFFTEVFSYTGYMKIKRKEKAIYHNIVV
jgi:hypothetical protein